MAAQPHTVTQSSALSICNATQQPGAFKSGMQNAGFEFSVPVKDESTIYYFCGVPSHCQKGMVRDELLALLRRPLLTKKRPSLQFGLINVRSPRFDCVSRVSPS
jgi:hypothetical protein